MAFGFSGSVINNGTDDQSAESGDEKGKIPRLRSDSGDDIRCSPELALEESNHDFKPYGCKAGTKTDEDSEKCQADVFAEFIFFKAEFHFSIDLAKKELVFMASNSVTLLPAILKTKMSLRNVAIP